MEKAAVITGVASGIGRETARQLVYDGWTVYGLDLAAQNLEEVSCDLAAYPGKFRHLVCDISSEQSIAGAFSLIGEQTSSIGALICSAGNCYPGLLADVSLDKFDSMLAVNLKGPWRCAVAALPLLRNGATVRDPSRVVMVSSIAAVRPKTGNGLYAATKAALDTLIGVMAAEFGPSGVTVNGVAPGSTDTPLWRAVQKPGSNYIVSGISPLGRVGQPADVASMIRILLGDDTKYVNGTIIPVDGGTRAAYTTVPYEPMD